MSQGLLFPKKYSDYCWQEIVTYFVALYERDSHGETRTPVNISDSWQINRGGPTWRV